MAQRRENNNVRTENFEVLIARYAALGEYEKMEAIRALALDVHAPIDENEIKEWTALYRMAYAAVNNRK